MARLRHNLSGKRSDAGGAIRVIGRIRLAPAYPPNAVGDFAEVRRIAGRRQRCRKAGRSGQRESRTACDHPARTPRRERACASAVLCLSGRAGCLFEGGRRGAIFRVCGAFQWGRPVAPIRPGRCQGCLDAPKSARGRRVTQVGARCGAGATAMDPGPGADPPRAVRKCRRSNPDCRYSPFSNRANIAILPGLAVRGAVLPVHPSVGRQAAADAAGLIRRGWLMGGAAPGRTTRTSRLMRAEDRPHAVPARIHARAVGKDEPAVPAFGVAAGQDHERAGCHRPE